MQMILGHDTSFKVVSYTYILILTTVQTLCLFLSPVLASPTDSLKPLRSLIIFVRLSSVDLVLILICGCGCQNPSEVFLLFFSLIVLMVPMRLQSSPMPLFFPMAASTGFHQPFTKAPVRSRSSIFPSTSRTAPSNSAPGHMTTQKST